MNYNIENSSGRRLVWISKHTIQGPRTLPKHHHALLEMSCVVRGTGTYRINGADYDMRPGDIFLFAPTDEHNLELGHEQLEHIVVHLEPSFVWNALGNDMDYKYLMVFFCRNPRFLCRLDRDNPAAPQLNRWFQEIWQESREQKDCYELMIKIRIQSILAQIIRSYSCIDTSKVARAASNGELECISQVLHYIDTHLEEEIRLPELAAIAHVSPSYFSTLFKQYNGLPPMEYVIGQRVRRAAEYIRTTDLPLGQVAAVCGFNNNTNFYKAFKRITGRTPAVYRQNANEPAESLEPPIVSTEAAFPQEPPPAAPQIPDYTADPCRLCSF